MVKAGSRIGEDQEGTLEELKISVIGKGKTIAEGAVVAPGEII